MLMAKDVLTAPDIRNAKPGPDDKAVLLNDGAWGHGPRGRRPGA
jgi:hypothetical protein